MTTLETARKALFQRIANAALLVLLPLVYFTPALLTRSAPLPDDGIAPILGTLSLIGKMIAAGQLPLWNPYTLAGTSLLASVPPGVFYPPNWLFAIFSPVTALWIVVITTCHLSLLGTYLYCRRIGLTQIGCLVAAIAFSFGAFTLAYRADISALAAAAWLPWLLLAIEHLCQRTSWRWITLGAVFIALQFFAGALEVSLSTLLISGSYVFFKWVEPEQREGRPRFLRSVIVMFVCGALLAMIQLLPLREMFNLGGHANISSGRLSEFSLSQILSLVLPILLPALCALFVKWENKLIKFWAVITLFFLCLAFEEYLRLGLNPTKYLFAFSFSLSILAGLDVSFIVQMEPAKIRRALRFTSIVIMAMVAAAVVIYLFWKNYSLAEISQPKKNSSLTSFAALLSIGCAILSLLAFWLYALRRNLFWGALLASLLFLGLVVSALFLNWERRISIAEINARLQDPPAVRFIKSREADFNACRIISHSTKRQGRNNGLNDRPTFSIAPGLRSVNGVAEMRLPRQTAIVGEMGVDGALPDLNIFNSEHQGLNLLNVKYLLVERELPDGLNPEAESTVGGAPGSMNSPDSVTQRWRRLAQFDGIEVYENSGCLPQAWFVKRAVVVPSSDVLNIIKTGRLMDGLSFNPAETVLLEREDFGSREIKLPSIGDPANAAVRVAGYEPNRIALQTRNAQPGFLVLSELYYRGWEAWIDGRRTPIERVNFALRGIAVQPGEHKIEFVFRAHSFRNGAVYTLLGILLLIIGAAASRIGSERLQFLIPSRVRDLVEPARARLSVPRQTWIFLRTKFSPSARDVVKAARETRAWVFLRARYLTIIAVLGLIIYGYLMISHASFAVGGSDSSGYASLGRLILQRNIVRPVTELAQFDLSDDYRRLFIPLAYIAGRRPGTMIPVYPPGLPLHSAIAALVFGWEVGPFLLGPLAAAISLILIYLIGRELDLSAQLSMIGALMLAVSPTVIYMGVQPMSDVPAMCWALATVFASLRSRKQARWALLAGFAFGVAFLIRPANILLLLPILLTLRLRLKDLLYFGLGGLPVAAIFLIYNAIAFDSPFQTGYGVFNIYPAFKLSYFAPRFKYYIYWLAMLMSPLLLLGWLGVAINREIPWRQRALLFSWFGAFLGFYCCYYDYEIWWYTRFLLPGLPALILGSLLTARYTANLLKRLVSERYQAMVGRSVTAFLLITVIGFAGYHIKLFALFNVGPDQIIHKESCLWADRMIPKQAFIVSMEMSGALKFYTDHSILRYDFLRPQQWPVIKSRAAEKGYSFYALLMGHEIEPAKTNLPGRWNYIGTYNQHLSLWQIEP